MQSWTHFLAVALLAVLFIGDASASVTKVSRGLTAFYPTAHDLARANAPASSYGLTNAERLRRRLPLKRPSFRRESDGPRMRARASPTFSTSASISSSESSTSATSTDSSSTSASTIDSASTSSASTTSESSSATSSSESTTSTALPSPTPTCPVGKPGVIQVSVNSTDPPIDGYISSILGPNGDYPFTTEVAEALIVTLSSASTDGSDSCSALDAISSNGNAAYPFFGGAKGFYSTDANLGVGSANYGYILGVTETPPLSTPQNYSTSFSQSSGITEAEESAIWVVDKATGTMTAQWVNSDGSLPATTLVVVSAVGAFGMLGDVHEFETVTGLQTFPVTFTFAPL